MEVDIKWWSVIAIITISLVAFLIIDGNKQVKSLDGCKTTRIRPFPKEFFSWEGMTELNKSGKYQPSCL